jgi:RimJ/RimL family protein N-acetyltransferase
MIGEAFIESQRLRLRPLTWDDLPFLVGLHADPEVSRFLGHGRPRSETETADWLTHTIEFQREGLGHLGVMVKGDDRLIGRCGLTCFEVEQGAEPPRGFWGRGSQPAGVVTTQVLELGYTLHRDAWGHGYATEAARRLRDEAFAARGEERIVSFIFEGNHRSIRVAGRNGLVERGWVEIFGRQARRYEVTAAEWRRLQSVG